MNDRADSSKYTVSGVERPAAAPPTCSHGVVGCASKARRYHASHTDGPSPFCDKCGYHTENCICDTAPPKEVPVPEEIINICDHGVVVSDGPCPQCAPSPPEVSEEMVERACRAFHTGMVEDGEVAVLAWDDWIKEATSSAGRMSQKHARNRMRGALQAALQKGEG